MLSPLQNPPECSATLKYYSFKLETISATLHRAAVSSVHTILLTFHCVAFNDFYNTSAPLNPNKNNYVITCWVLPPVYKDGTTSEWQKEKMSFLSAVSFIFSVCSPRSLSFTGRRQKSDAGDGKGWKAETERVEPAAQDRRMDHGLPRHSACQYPSRCQSHTLLLHPWLLPWWHFVCQHRSSKKGCLRRSRNNLFSKTNRHTQYLQAFW